MTMNHYAIPRGILKKRGSNGPDGQQTLADVIQNMSKKKEFSREGVLRAVAEFVVCDDQVRTLRVSLAVIHS